MININSTKDIGKKLIPSSLSALMLLFTGSAFADTDDPYHRYCKGAGFEGKKIPCKQIKIQNNTTGPIYPVLKNGAKPVDEWLQAEMKVPKNQTSTMTYPKNMTYRVYINWPNGVAPGKSVTIDVPLYSELVNSPNATSPDNYANWWNGGRIAIYDKKGVLEKEHELDLKGGTTAQHQKWGKVTPVTPGPQCANDSNSVCTANSMQVFSNPADLKDESPSQLVEFTFGGSVENDDSNSNVARKMYYQDIGYNISYVDHLYLPIALAPLGNKYIGYNGSVMKNDIFKGVLKNFHEGKEKWPIFVVEEEDVLKLPGGHNLIMKSKNENQLTGGKEAYHNIIKLWKSCLPEHFGKLDDEVKGDYKCPAERKAQLEKVWKFFELNRQQYESNQYVNGRVVERNGSCDDKKYFDDMDKQGWNVQELLLARIYGWVPFIERCPSGDKTNALCKTTDKADDKAINKGKEKYVEIIDDKPVTKYRDVDYLIERPTICTKMYHDVHKIYRDLQYSFKDGQKPKFNPYVEVIHDKNQLNMDAYAFSIDDAVGFMLELGHGLNVTVGGKGGLENEQRFDPRRAIEGTMGSSGGWVKYGACDKPFGESCDEKDMIYFPAKANNFKLANLPKFPIKVELIDANNQRYEIMLPADFHAKAKYDEQTPSGPKRGGFECKDPNDGKWCQSVYAIITKDEEGNDEYKLQGTSPVTKN
jgi:hypothetical protein